MRRSIPSGELIVELSGGTYWFSNARIELLFTTFLSGAAPVLPVSQERIFLKRNSFLIGKETGGGFANMFDGAPVDLRPTVEELRLNRMRRLSGKI